MAMSPSQYNQTQIWCAAVKAANGTGFTQSQAMHILGAPGGSMLVDTCHDVSRWSCSVIKVETKKDMPLMVHALLRNYFDHLFVSLHSQ